ncbi:MAG TPA: LysM peptidoglycan-binding domain-containing protein [Candidatus Binataceae bacterium]|jgi:LysM repeat protein
MGTYPNKWRVAAFRLTLFVALMLGGGVLFMPVPVAATPLEEDIPQSPAPPHVKARPVKPPLAEPAGTPAAAPAASDVQPSSESGAPADASTSPVARPDANPSPTHEHKYFPYTIRSGDTLEAIADLFGVQVSDITRVNHRITDTDLMVGDTLRIPNPFVTREAELNAEIERLSIDKQEAERKGDQATEALASVHSQLDTAAASNAHYEHDLHSLPWWRAAAWSAAIAGLVMFGMMAAAVIEWWNLRARYRAVAEMNDSLRRLDYRYRMVMAKAELRLQELYGRRRHGIEEGQERPKIPEELELERLDLQIKEILEGYLDRVGPPSGRSRRARWRELIGAVGAPIEARTARR